MARKRYKLPTTIQLYWLCDYCRVAMPWPESWASMYCSNACKMKVYRLRVKEKQGYDIVLPADFDQNEPEDEDKTS